MKQFSCEELSKMNDKELQTHLMSVRGMIHSQKRRKEMSRELEIYYCYVLREAQNRNFV